MLPVERLIFAAAEAIDITMASPLGPPRLFGLPAISLRSLLAFMSAISG